ACSLMFLLFFFSSRRRHTRSYGDWSSDVCSSDLETVAVVTNPAIDREREIEHFSTRVVLGPRPGLRSRARGGVRSLRSRNGGPSPRDRWLELRIPILLGGHAAETGMRSDDERALARRLGT